MRVWWAILGAVWGSQAGLGIPGRILGVPGED